LTDAPVTTFLPSWFGFLMTTDAAVAVPALATTSAMQATTSAGDGSLGVRLFRNFISDLPRSNRVIAVERMAALRPCP
jgi:hypothetical protein